MFTYMFQTNVEYGLKLKSLLSIVREKMKNIGRNQYRVTQHISWNSVMTI